MVLVLYREADILKTVYNVISIVTSVNHTLSVKHKLDGHIRYDSYVVQKDYSWFSVAVD